MKVLVALLMVACTTTMFAQDAEADSSASNDAFDMSMGFTTSQPFFRPLGGITSWSLQDASDIENSITFGAVLGFESTKNIPNSSIAKNQANGLYVTYHSAGDVNDATYALQAWRFGFSSSESYGYRFSNDGEAGIYLGSTKAPLSWYSVSVEGVPTNPSGLAAISRFPDALRFGEAATANVDIRVAGPVSVNLGYEWAQVYERHLFWYWGLSSIIEGLADGAAGWFTRSIGKSSPAALPVMHFILRNAIAMGFKALRMEQMNWPFTTVAPLNIQTINLGVNVVF